MAASFLQYCATCEKQIHVPDSSVLYCSESCRKHDVARPLSYKTPQPSPPLASFYLPTPDELARPARDIIPPASPTARTVPRALKYNGEDVESPDWDGSAARMSLRDWQRSATDLPTISQHRKSLSSTSTPFQTFSETSSSSKYSNRRSLSFMTHPLARLSEGLAAPTSQPYTNLPTSASYNSLSSLARPLPPRHNPHSYSASPKSIDLVTPFTYANGSASHTAVPTMSTFSNQTSYNHGSISGNMDSSFRSMTLADGPGGKRAY